MQSNHRYFLPPDPAPRSTELDGAAEVIAPAMPATPATPAMSTTPTMSQQMAVAREEIIILRAALAKLATSLNFLAGTIEADLDQAAGRSRAEADRKRRFQ